MKHTLQKCCTMFDRWYLPSRKLEETGLSDRNRMEEFLEKENDTEVCFPNIFRNSFFLPNLVPWLLMTFIYPISYNFENKNRKTDVLYILMICSSYVMLHAGTKLECQPHLFGNPPHTLISFFIQVDYVSSSHPFVAVHFILECGAKLEAEAITISTAARCPFLGPE